MDFFETVNSRYSYRGDFTSEKLKKDEIKKILEAGISAPAGMHTYTTNYVAIDDPKLIEEMGKFMSSNGTKTAPFVLVILSENKMGKGSMNFEIENYSAAVENILLAVTALGYSTVWTEGVCRTAVVNNGIRRLLNVPLNKTIKAVLPIGRAENPGSPKHRQRIENCVTFNHF